MSEKASSFICQSQDLCRKIAAIERQQPLPVPLGGVAVVDRPLWKRKTVMGAGIELDLGMGAIGLHLLLDLLDDLHRRVYIGLGATEVNLGLGLLAGQMRAVGPVGGQLHAVYRSCGFDPFRKMRGGIDGVLPAHAVADGADDLGVGGRLVVGVSE